jgi:hypothetical protein
MELVKMVRKLGIFKARGLPHIHLFLYVQLEPFREGTLHMHLIQLEPFRSYISKEHIYRPNTGDKSKGFFKVYSSFLAKPLSH